MRYHRLKVEYRGTRVSSASDLRADAPHVPSPRHQTRSPSSAWLTASPPRCIVVCYQASTAPAVVMLLYKGIFVTKMWSIHPRPSAWLDNQANYNTSRDCVHWKYVSSAEESAWELWLDCKPALLFRVLARPNYSNFSPQPGHWGDTVKLASGIYMSTFLAISRCLHILDRVKILYCLRLKASIWCLHSTYLAVHVSIYLQILDTVCCKA